MNSGSVRLLVLRGSPLRLDACQRSAEALEEHSRPAEPSRVQTRLGEAGFVENWLHTYGRKPISNSADAARRARGQPGPTARPDLDDTAGPQSHAEYRKDDSSRQSIPGAHFKVAAAFVSDALEIDYSPAAAAKAIQKFRSRHPNFMLMNWPYQPPAEEDEFVQSLQ